MNCILEFASDVKKTITLTGPAQLVAQVLKSIAYTPKEKEGNTSDYRHSFTLSLTINILYLEASLRN
ncbi:hypothetical protein D3C87_2044750 [compost metagenome]